MAKVAIILGCMDPRLNTKIGNLEEGLKERYGEDTECWVFRNGGGNAKDIKRSLMQALGSKNTEMVAIYSMQHGDCAANKVVKKAIEDKKAGLDPEPSELIMTSLVSQFDGEDLSNTDATNRRLQIREVQAMARGRDMDVEDAYVKKEELPEKSHEHSAVMILEPAYSEYPEIATRLKVNMGGMYVLQALDARDLLPDIDILKMLDFKEVTLVELGDNKKQYDGAAALVKGAGMEVNRVELTRNAQNHHSKSRTW